MTDFFNDLTSLSLDDSVSTVGVSEVLVRLDIRKPSRQEFVRVHSEYSLTTTVFVDKEEGSETYLVMPTMRAALLSEVNSVTLVPAISRQGAVFIWPVRLPGEDGGRNTWAATAYQAARLAKEQWVRLSSDRAMSGYRIYRAEGQLPEPVWPDKPFKELLEIAFRGRVIETEDHPIIRRLRGL